MAPSRLRRRRQQRRLKILALAAGLTLTATAAYADWPVVDVASITNEIKQINTMTQQLSTEISSLNVLQGVQGLMGNVQSAIGSAGHITLPTLNLNDLASQIRGDMSCLIPSKPSWGINFQQVSLGSICNLASQYQTALFVGADTTSDGTSSSSSTDTSIQQTALQLQLERQSVQSRRRAMLGDTATRAMGQADVQQQQAQNLNNTADDLQTALDAAQTEMDRLHVIAEVGIAQLRATAARNQIQAQQLKLQAAVIVRDLPPDWTGTPMSSGSGTGSN